MTKYEPLTQFLKSVDTSEIPLTFSEVERILGFPLPQSAFKHRPWWANQKDHVPADAWMTVGWQVDVVDLAGERVVFRKAGHTARRRGRPSMPPDTVAVPLSALEPSVRAALDAHMREHGCGRVEAVVALLNQAGLARRRAIFDWFDEHGSKTPGASSAALIREDRDAR